MRDYTARAGNHLLDSILKSARTTCVSVSKDLQQDRSYHASCQIVRRKPACIDTEQLSILQVLTSGSSLFS